MGTQARLEVNGYKLELVWEPAPSWSSSSWDGGRADDVSGALLDSYTGRPSLGSSEDGAQLWKRLARRRARTRSLSTSPSR